MHDDDLMDQLLRDAMPGEVPRLSADFDERVMRQVRPRTLTPLGRAAISLYVVLAAAAAAWAMRDLNATVIVAALLITLSIAAGTMAYMRRLASAAG